MSQAQTLLVHAESYAQKIEPRAYPQMIET